MSVGMFILRAPVEMVGPLSDYSESRAVRSDVSARFLNSCVCSVPVSTTGMNNIVAPGMGADRSGLFPAQSGHEAPLSPLYERVLTSGTLNETIRGSDTDT